METMQEEQPTRPTHYRFSFLPCLTDLLLGVECGGVEVLILGRSRVAVAAVLTEVVA